MTEQDLHHGVIRRNPIKKKVQRLTRYVQDRRIAMSGIPFDFQTGYDVRDYIGNIPIKNQGKNDSCSGQAGSYFLEIQRRLKGIKEGAISAKSIYSLIAYSGGGTTVNALETQIGANGANLETTVASNDISGNPLPEIYMESTEWRTFLLIRDAANRAGYLPNDVAPEINTVASTIKQYGAVILEVQGQDNGTWLSSLPIAPNNHKGLWQHFLCAVGAKLVNGKGCIIVLNSLGTNIGEQGVQYISEDYFNSGHVLNVSAFIPMDLLQPLPENHSIWAEVIRYLKSLLPLKVA